MPPIARQITPAEERRILEAQRRLDRAEQQAQELVRNALTARDREILSAVERGASLASIGRALGITRQAVGLAANRARERG